MHPLRIPPANPVARPNAEPIRPVDTQAVLRALRFAYRRCREEACESKPARPAGTAPVRV